MNSAPIKSALKHAGAWATVLTFIGLLTIIFSFLGTLFCAAAGGMMMGATKASRKLSVAFSVFCPAVLLTTMRIQKTELSQQQVMVLAGLCLGVFWLLYILSWLLVACEQNGGSAKTSATPAPVSATIDHSERASESVRLDQLEGKWCSENSANSEAQRHKRILEINNGDLALSALDAQGQICYCARGRMKLVDDNDGAGVTLPPAVELAAGI